MPTCQVSALLSVLYTGSLWGHRNELNSVLVNLSDLNTLVHSNETEVRVMADYGTMIRLLYDNMILTASVLSKVHC